MDSTSQATTVNDNTNISCSKDQIINSPTLHILDDIENINETNTPACCASSTNEIVLKLDEPVEQSVEEDLAEEFKLLKSPVNKSNSEMESQSKLTEIECNMHSDNTVGQVDFDSSHLSGIKIVELESGNDEDILATVNSEKHMSVPTGGIKKTLKDPNAMLEIPTYIDNSNSDCEMSNDYFYMCAKENDSDSVIDTKDLNLEPENPENQSNFENDVMKLLKNEEKILTTDFENRIKNESNIDLCQSPESKERLPNDALILIDPEEPDIINITEDDDILESTPNMASTESVVSNNEELSNALKELDTDLNSSCNIISSQNSDASEDRLTSDTEGLTQSDISFMSDIVLVHDPDKETKCEDTDLLLPSKDIEISIDPNKVTETIFTETKSIGPQLTAKDSAKEITLSVSETKPSIDPSKFTNIDSVSTISKINQDICTTNSNDCISLNNLAEKCIHSTSEIGQQHIIDDTMTSTSEINNQTNISHSGTPTKLSCHIEDNSKVLISKLENSKTILTQNPRDDLLEKKNNMKDPLLPKEIKIIDDAILPQQNLEKENVLSPSKDHKIQTKQDNILPNTSKDAETSNSEISMIIEDNEVVNALTNISKDLKGRNVPQNNILIEETIKSDVTMTSTSKKVIPEISQPVKDQIQPVQENQEPIASTSKTDEDGQNTSDSLGLLAELSRIMEEEEDEEDNDDGENVDDEDEFDPDYESTNQMAAEQSEDSNTRHSEVEGKESRMNEKIADRPFEFNMEKDPVTIPKILQQDESTADANENEDIEEMTVEAQDTIELKSDTSDIDDNKSKDLPEVKTDKSPSAITTDVVDLDSEDDIQETKDDSDVTSVNLPAGIDVIASHSSSANTDMRVKEGEIVISGIPKPTSVKVARLNTAEVSIKTTKLPTLEVFNLDSDDDMEVDKQAEDIPDISDETIPMKSRKCMNEACPHLTNVFYVADSSAMSFYNAKKCRYVCDVCAEAVVRRNERLIEGIRNFEDLVLLDMGKDLKDSIEVLDSDSDDDVDPEDLAKEVVGEEGAKLLEVQLADIFNEQWKKYKMDARLLDSVDSLKNEMDELERQSKEVDDMLKQCQKSTDSLRNELYGTFKPEIKQLPPLTICDMSQVKVQEKHYMETRLAKRRLSSNVEISAKRKPDCGKTTKSENTSGLGDKLDDDNTDITVVQLSTENAPPDLPSVGELERPPLRVGMPVYAMKNMFGTWSKAHIIEVNGASNSPYSTCRIKFHKNQKNMFLSISARNLAYCEPANARLTIGTRAIALFQGSAESVKETKQREKYYSGIVAEVPNPVNNFRYLIFFDDGYAQYAKHADTRLVCEYSTQVWEDVHPFSRLFVKEYLFNYPQRPMVRLKANETIKTEWKDKWWPSKVVKVDASLVLVQFLMGESKARLEWIYRGSTRLEPLYREIQAAGRQRQRAMPRPQSLSRPNMPIVEYMRSDEQAKVTELQNIKDINNEELRRQRAVAKKSTAMPTPPPPPNPALVKLDSFHSRVVYYTPKKAVRPYKITANHVCGPSCKRKDVLSLKDLLTYNPLAKPLLSGWERQIVRTKYDKRVMYRAPCGRRVRNMVELLCYLQVIKSDMGVDLFDFGPNTHCLAEFVINKYIVSKKDLANGKENVPVPCVNFYDSSLPEFCAYSTERTPTAGVPLNLDPEFLCGCDCEDDCEDKTKCACWKLTLEGAKTIGIEGEDVGYAYRRLPEPLRTGIYECNSRCKCKSTCLNRVVQHPLQLKLQVFKTPNRGWGIRALNDVPKGCFICIYVGNLLTDATANLDGLNEGDEYLAELDYIEVVEQTKEGFEEDVPDSIKALDKKESDTTSEGTDSPNEEEEEEEAMDPSEDEEFKPFAGYQLGVTQFNKRLRKRKKKEEDDQGKAKHEETEKEGTGDGCITISDDEEVREPSRFTAAAGIGDGDFVPRHRSVRKLFGEDEACYIMDAKVQGNIGRYLNHSCCPNVFVQNVFVDTHDPRFPWVAFFASSHIKAGKELTWNYNYDIGSVPGKVLYCYCGETNCRGRLL